MVRPGGAVAIFVKTPGLSPVKTRLARTIGREAAEEFYRLSVQAVEAVVRRASEDGRLVPYWAVAEPDGLDHRLWRGFARVAQGGGGLGERLAHVYDELIGRHPFVLFLGADSPQISPGILLEAIDTLADAVGRSLVLGRSHDGGFYLFGGSESLSPDVWCDVPYSQSDTAEELAERLRRIAPVAELPKLCDVDCAEDLALLREELWRLSPILPEQARVLEWVERHVERA